MSKFLEVANEPISFGNSISSYVSPQGELYFTPPVSFFWSSLSNLGRGYSYPLINTLDR
jgi:hypothetical protein